MNRWLFVIRVVCITPAVDFFLGCTLTCCLLNHLPQTRVSIVQPQLLISVWVAFSSFLSFPSVTSNQILYCKTPAVNLCLCRPLIRHFWGASWKVKVEKAIHYPCPSFQFSLHFPISFFFHSIFYFLFSFFFSDSIICIFLFSFFSFLVSFFFSLPPFSGWLFMLSYKGKISGEQSDFFQLAESIRTSNFDYEILG